MVYSKLPATRNPPYIRALKISTSGTLEAALAETNSRQLNYTRQGCNSRERTFECRIFRGARGPWSKCCCSFCCKPSHLASVKESDASSYSVHSHHSDHEKMLLSQIPLCLFSGWPPSSLLALLLTLRLFLHQRALKCSLPPLIFMQLRILPRFRWQRNAPSV